LATLEVACDWRFVARLHDVGRPDQPAHPPAGHRVGLGHAVDDDATVRDARHQLRHRGELRAAVDEVLVDLVGDDPDAVLLGPAPDRLDLLRRVDGAGRVGRRDEDEQLGPRVRADSSCSDRRAVAGVLAGPDLDRHPAGQPDRLGVGRPVGRRQDRLVAGVEQRGEGVVEGLLAAVGHDDLAGLDQVPGVAHGLGRDRLAQGGAAPASGV
jgi:hypothetical protein